MHSLSLLLTLFMEAVFLIPSTQAGAGSPYFARSLGPNVHKYAVGKLPDVDHKLTPSWAGQIPVQGTKDDELFFWLFEAETQSNELLIWFQGGPGCAGLGGMAKENGPVYFPGNSSTPQPNPYSWTKLANVLYVDQPVGTGFSGGSNPANNNTEITAQFYNWLKVFYHEFPGLQSKDTYLMGESYAGIYIPYFTQIILANQKSLPITLKSITIGDGNFGNIAALTDVPVGKYLREQNKLLKIPQDVLAAFDRADRQCGFDQVLRQLMYPPHGKISIPGNPEQENFKRQDDCFSTNPNTPALINESVNALCYGGCATWSTASNYLQHKNPCFSIYNINYTCGTAPPQAPFLTYLNRPSVQKAIHAPRKSFEACNNTLLQALSDELVTPPAYEILPAILAAGVPVHLYSADYDFLFNHIGTELLIQNMTWCNKQGLQQRPTNPFLVDSQLAGHWGAERGLTYHHLLRAGHAVPVDQPAVAFAYVRDFVLGNGGYLW